MSILIPSGEVTVYIDLNIDMKFMGEIGISNVIKQYLFLSTSKETSLKIENSLKHAFLIDFDVEIVDEFTIKIKRKDL